MIFLCLVSILYLNIYPVPGRIDREYYLADMDNGENNLLEVEDLQTYEKKEKRSIQVEEPYGVGESLNRS